MSYLAHLAARALGLKGAAIRPVLAPYFLPVAPGRPAQGAEERGAPPQAQPGVLPRDGALPPPQAAAAPAGLPGDPVGDGARLIRPRRARRATAHCRTGPGGSPYPPGRGCGCDSARPGTGAPRARAPGRLGDARAQPANGGPAHRRRLICRARPPPGPAQPGPAEPPSVHIHIGRVELRAVPAPLGPPQPAASESARRVGERRAGSSLEEYLARPHGGGS